MKYFIGILIGGAGGFLIGYVWNKFQKKEKSDSIKLNVSSYLVRIGELRVYRAYMKEIVTSVDHVWGDIGKKYFSWMLSEKKLAMVFEFEVDFVYNLLSKDFKVLEDAKGISIKMPRCKYDVKIKDFYFYDEQGTRLKILPEFLSSIFDGGVSEEEKNELVKMAIKQVEEISKKVAMNIQSDVDKTTRETINNLIVGFHKRIDSFKFYENNISLDQINIENPSLLETKLTKK
ncbi:MAG: hypothetical protein CMG55_05015 [Candidatus Marinimicrobia bacterium]|nr:hypothetical protein [Candidatus Neomarinimicrobiota bacterium]|tara:strand:+ start:179 stop:874 length:696 start_codon:yes stop_codon:yes gene_type:complete